MAGPKFFVGRSDRLIARLKDFLWAWRFADQVGGQLFYLWPKLPKRYDSEQSDYSPHMIFDLLEFYRDGGADRLTFVECDRITFPDGGIALEDEQFEGERRDGFDRGYFQSSPAHFVQRGTAPTRFAGYYFNDEPCAGAYRLADVQRLFAELPTDPRLVELIANFKETSGIGKEYSAVHVRRGDCYSMLRDALIEGCDDSRLRLLVKHIVTRTAPIEFYRAEIERMIAKGQKIVFTSDSPDSIREFRRIYGPDHFIDLALMRTSVPIQKAYADFLMLYGASRIAGTGSNFSRFAAQLKNTPFVNVSGAGPVETARAAFDREIVADRTVDRQMLKDAHRHLEQLYDAHLNRERGPLTVRPTDLAD